MSYLGTKNKTLFAHEALVDRIKLECGYIGPSEVLCTMTGIFVRTEIQRQIWIHKESRDFNDKTVIYRNVNDDWQL